MPAVRERLQYRGFELRLENGFTADEARGVVERVLETGGDRVSFYVPRKVSGGPLGRPPLLFVKAEFRRPDQPLSKRLKPARAVAEGRGYRAFAAAGLRVATLLAFGEQSRLRPRAGAIVVTEKVRGRDAAKLWKRGPDAELLARVARALAAIHAAGLVHGDAVMRNFILSAGAEYAIDLPGWSAWSRARAERDLSLLVGSAMRLGADSAQVLRCLVEYEEADGAPARRLADGWRDRTVAEGDAYRRHLIERDATRGERRARKRSIARPRERGAARRDAGP